MLYLVRVMRKIFCFIICRTGNVSKEIATKRPIRRKARLPKKRLKLAPFVPPPVQIPAKPEQLLSTQDVFEQPTTQVQQKKIELRLPDLPVTNPRDGDSGKQFTIECLALSAYINMCIVILVLIHVLYALVLLCTLYHDHLLSVVESTEQNLENAGEGGFGKIQPIEKVMSHCLSI